MVIHCADVGSVKKGNFGWARLLAENPSADNAAADAHAQAIEDKQTAWLRQKGIR